MTNQQLNRTFDNMTPSAKQKERIWNTIVQNSEPAARKTKFGGMPRKAFLGTAAACLVLAAALIFTMPFGRGTTAFALSVTMPNGASVQMEDWNRDKQADGLVSSASYVDNGPELRFYITGEDIARIEISSEKEFVSAHDWTQTLDEKYWNPELYYQEAEIDGTVYQYVPSRSLFEKSIVLNFPEGFEQYDEVWYTWYGWNLRDWASQDNYAHIQGYNGLTAADTEKLLENATEDEKLAIAAGGGSTSAAGHILLDGYPEDQLSDRVAIAITDRQGNTVTRTLTVKISNNAFGQTVVTANLED